MHGAQGKREGGPAQSGSGEECRPRRGVQYLDGLKTIRFTDNQSDRMQPLEPRHHPARIVPYQIGVDAVCIQHCLRDVRLDLVGEGPDYGIELRQLPFHSHPRQCH